MELVLKRHFCGPNYTIGRLYIDGVYFCDTLEDAVRHHKIPGETAVPAGTYKVIVTHSPKFGRKLPLLLNVPHFSGIRIHRGNTPDDTAGCILVGENREKGRLLQSAGYELRLTRMLQEQPCPHDLTIA